MNYDQIWAPWRLGYIQEKEKSAEEESTCLEYLPNADLECFLCQAVADKAESAAARRHVVYRDTHCIALLNRYPYNNGHLLVAPNRHVGRLNALTAEENGAISLAITRMIATLEKALQPEGFNIGLNLGRAAGAGLPQHLHWHIVPRWNGDTNFMPLFSAVNVIPQSLDALWEALTANDPSGPTP